MTNLRDWRKRIKEQEKQRIEDVYEACEKRGCDRHFLSTFDTRAWLFPEAQAKAFLSLRNSRGIEQERLADQLRQYRIFLEVLIEKRPNHEKNKEWVQALELLKNERTI